jgi:uncharacterized protein YfaS (alpha-2-macroglobulin family)
MNGEEIEFQGAVTIDPSTGEPVGAEKQKPILGGQPPQIGGFVLDARTGEPVPGAEVESWGLGNQGNRIAGPKVTTDDNGFFSFKAENNVGYLIRARHHGQELASAENYHANGYVIEALSSLDAERVFFFTDRAIYRPGQTIQYKGIAVKIDQRQDDYQVLANREINVIFTDPNGKEIARQKHRCNDYGSFSGSFVAPRDRLLGSMQIRAEDVPIGSTQISVEEYKRPKFQVTLDTPQVAPRLNEKVSLQGHALSYTGAAVDSAQVRYRVVRGVRWPYWYSGAASDSSRARKSLMATQARRPMVHSKSNLSQSPIRRRRRRMSRRSASRSTPM